MGKKIVALLKKYRELIRYVFFGVLTTLVNFVVLKLVLLAFGDRLVLLWNAVAWLASVLFAFVTNKLFVFESKSWGPKLVLKEASTFAAARLTSLGIEEAGLWLLLDVFGMRTLTLNLGLFCLSGIMTAKVILAVIVVIMNYFFSKLVTFRKPKEKN